MRSFKLRSRAIESDLFALLENRRLFYIADCYYLHVAVYPHVESRIESRP